MEQRILTEVDTNAEVGITVAEFADLRAQMETSVAVLRDPKNVREGAEELRPAKWNYAAEKEEIDALFLGFFMKKGSFNGSEPRLLKTALFITEIATKKGEFKPVYMYCNATLFVQGLEDMQNAEKTAAAREKRVVEKIFFRAKATDIEKTSTGNNMQGFSFRRLYPKTQK